MSDIMLLVIVYTMELITLVNSILRFAFLDTAHISYPFTICYSLVFLL